jgi:hypothetical protein
LNNPGYSIVAVPFTRSLRSAEADSLYPSLIGLCIACIILSTWLGWFLLARITLYETSVQMQVQEDDIIVADFPITAQGNVQRGQAALLHLEGVLGAEYGPIPLIVVDVFHDPVVGRVQAHLFPAESAGLPFDTRDGLAGRIEVEAEHITPAVLLMRNVGQFSDTPRVRTSPQLLSPADQ